jgi:hypothetical protein
MIYAKELFSCMLGMDDFGDEEHKEDIGDERERKTKKRTMEMRERKIKKRTLEMRETNRRTR